jgi:hypothetical protein
MLVTLRGAVSNEQATGSCPGSQGRARGGALALVDAVNGLIELHRRIAHDFRNRDNYRLRMLLIGGGLDPSSHTQR